MDIARLKLVRGNGIARLGHNSVLSCVAWRRLRYVVCLCLSVVALEQRPSAAVAQLAPSLASNQVTFLVWLSNGLKSLPNPKVLRPGDGLVIAARRADAALNSIDAVRDAIRDHGVNPDQFKYIIRTFPGELAASGSAPAAFFRDVPDLTIRRLREITFAIGFDHERAWYDRSPDRLPPWNWSFDWTREQVGALASTVRGEGFRVATLVTPSGTLRWFGPNGQRVVDGYADLLKGPDTKLNYLVVQSQPFCRSDETGGTFRGFAEKISSELERVFAADANRAAHMTALQISLGDRVDPFNRKANYVPPEWALRCLHAAISRRTSEAQIEAFFLWSRGHRASCELIRQFRHQSSVTCE